MNMGINTRDQDTLNGMQLLIAAMNKKLEENKHKLPWTDESVTVEKLKHLLIQEVLELVEEINLYPKNKREIIFECADIANFCMMIAHKIYTEILSSQDKKYADMREPEKFFDIELPKVKINHMGYKWFIGRNECDSSMEEIQ